jgi:hypothetical protein
MNRLILALALTPALLVTAASAQTVSDDVSKQLWCGSAMVAAFSNPPSEGVTQEQLDQAKIYVDGGNQLIELASQAHLDAGFTQEALDKLKAEIVEEVTVVVTGTGEGAKYSFEECEAILPAATDASSSSSSSAM